MRWTLALTLLPLAGCGTTYSRAEVEARDANWQAALEDLRIYQDQLEAENEDLLDEIGLLRVDVQRARAASAREASAEIEEAFAELEAAMKGLAVYSSGGLEYLQGPDGPVVRIQDQVLFASGSHNLTDEGRRVLASVAAELARLDRPIRVIGHTDDQPVRVRSENYPNGNLELSAARAVEAASVLIANGVPAARVSVVGYGEWRPIEPNAGAQGRARNRRVEIAVLPPSPGD